MKRIFKSILNLAASIGFTALLFGCAAMEADFMPKDYGADLPAMREAVEQSGPDRAQSGVVTAAEWNDIANWNFWGSLMNNSEWVSHASSWMFYPNKFAYVLTCTADKKPVAGCVVVLKKDGKDVWNAVSDNSGVAVVWDGMFSTEYNPSSDGYTLIVDGETQPGFEFTTLSKSEPVVNECVVKAKAKDNAIDVAFIVDATGSMSDEINFLKADLIDIIDLVGKQCNASVRTGTVFYRDEGDDYVTKHSKFTKKVEETAKYISKQEANGGGDYPEAVHSALLEGIQSLDWNSNARSHIAFLILDAPPHHLDHIIAECQKAVSDYSKYGIKLIPVACSGIDKETEYLLRSFALATNGTYVFITDDSGVGGDHIEATVGEYEVEKLRDLIARLIIAYAK